MPVPNWIMTSGLPAPATADPKRRIPDRTLHEVRGRTILGDNALHVRPDDLQLLHRVLAGVVHDVAGIEEHAEVRMVDLLDPREQVERRVVQAMVMLDDDPDAELLPERRGLRQDLAPLDPALFVLDPEIERVLFWPSACAFVMMVLAPATASARDVPF